MAHTTKVFHTLKEFLACQINNERHARAVWKAHVEKHGNVPLIHKCSICHPRETTQEKRTRNRKERKSI